MSQTENEIVEGIGSDYLTKYGFSNPDEAEDYFFKSGRGISHEVVEAIAEHKNEPDWMRKFRHKSLDYFLARPLPMWGGDLTQIDFENIYYYIRPTEKQAERWEDLPAAVRWRLDTDRLEAGLRPPAHRQAVDRHRAGGGDLDVGQVGLEDGAGDHRASGVAGAEDEDRGVHGRPRAWQQCEPSESSSERTIWLV